MAVAAPADPSDEAPPPAAGQPPAAAAAIIAPPASHHDESNPVTSSMVDVKEKRARAKIPLVKVLALRPAPAPAAAADDDAAAGHRAKKPLHEGHPLSRLAQANRKIGMVDNSISQLRWRLKTQPGWRQQRRWQSDAFIGVPNKQPPEPADWEVHHTHEPVFPPYQLAARWDAGGLRQRVQEKTLRAQVSRKACARRAGIATGLGAGEVPRDLREAAKRNAVVKAWVQALEEPVRAFAQAVAKTKPNTNTNTNTSSSSSADGFEEVRGEDDTEEELADQDEIIMSEVDSDFEVLLFKGRAHARKLSIANSYVEVDPCVEEEEEQGEEEDEQPCLVLDGFGDNDSSFKRWLAHALAAYYGLESRSVTVDAGRVVEIRAKPATTRKQKKKAAAAALPRLMWELC